MKKFVKIVDTNQKTIRRHACGTGFQNSKPLTQLICVIGCILVFIVILTFAFFNFRKKENNVIRKGAWTVEKTGNLWKFETKDINIRNSNGELKYKLDFIYYWGETIESRSVELHISLYDKRDFILNSTDAEVTYKVTMNGKEFQGIASPWANYTTSLVCNNYIVLSYFASMYVDDAFSGECSELTFTINDSYEFTIYVDKDMRSLYEKITSEN